MTFKKSYLDLRSKYIKLEKNYKLLLKKIKPKDISDSLVIQSFLENETLYPKDDFPKIIALSKKYLIKTSNLKKKTLEYFNLLDKLSEYNKKLEEISLRDIHIGPSSIQAVYNKEEIIVQINKNKIKVIAVNKKTLKKLSSKIEKILKS